MTKKSQRLPKAAECNQIGINKLEKKPNRHVLAGLEHQATRPLHHQLGGSMLEVTTKGQSLALRKMREHPYCIHSPN